MLKSFFRIAAIAFALVMLPTAASAQSGTAATGTIAGMTPAVAAAVGIAVVAGGFVIADAVDDDDDDPVAPVDPTPPTPPTTTTPSTSTPTTATVSTN